MDISFHAKDLNPFIRFLVTIYYLCSRKQQVYDDRQCTYCSFSERPNRFVVQPLYCPCTLVQRIYLSQISLLFISYHVQISSCLLAGSSIIILLF